MKRKSTHSTIGGHHRRQRAAANGGGGVEDHFRNGHAGQELETITTEAFAVAHLSVPLNCLFRNLKSITPREKKVKTFLSQMRYVAVPASPASKTPSRRFVRGVSAAPIVCLTYLYRHQHITTGPA
jgi:hypothetical protein